MDAPEDEPQQIEILKSTDDRFGGVFVKMDEAVPMDSATFLPLLRASISHWKHLGKKGVWIKLPINLVSLVEVLVKEGFWYHHAEPKFLMLVYWIPEGAHNFPDNASHRVGVCALVVNEKLEVLVVKKKSGPGAWRFPTGNVDQGENIFAAAEREVKEETGIDSEFLEVLAFRQSHTLFCDEKSTLIFVCLLRPLNFDIQIQEKEVEVEGAKWMHFDEYAAQPYMEKYELMRHINDIYLAKIDRKYSGFSSVSTPSVFSHQKSSYLYLDAEALKPEEE